MTEIDLLVLDPSDNVGVAPGPLARGKSILNGTVIIGADIPQGHKVAISPISANEHVRKYGQSIGLAKMPIGPGDHVHSHNLTYVEEDNSYEFASVQAKLPDPSQILDPEDMFFEGYRRANGKAGTRNYIGILASVNCSASTAKMIAEAIKPELVNFPNVDGVVALTHTSGCGMIPDSSGGSTMQRTLRGYAEHQNFGGLLVLGLGCEMLQVKEITDDASIPEDTLVDTLVIQDEGGIRATVSAGVEAILRQLPILNARKREKIPVSELVLGLNCGGSDGYSGITANPALGYASDLLVACGGTSVLAETPEIFGAESLLTRRSVTAQVGQKLLDRIAWWKDYVAGGEGSLDNNPSPGNKAGGLTTILEKSLGAVAKSGQASLNDVLLYGEKIVTSGLLLMDTPGYDPVSLTGLIAGGANILVFTTGRGSVIGARPTPVIKVSTNNDLYNKMTEDMDLNAGDIISGKNTIEQVGVGIFREIVAVASGKKTVSEQMLLGQEEFVPWQLGAVT